MLDRAESGIQSWVQNWIADPLQFAGIDLDRQLRLLCGIIAICCVVIACREALAHQWLWVAFTGLLILAYLSCAVYGISLPHKVAMMGSRREWLLWSSAIVLHLLSWVMLSVLTKPEWLVFEITILLRWFLVRCKPKPPIGNLQTASDPI